MSKCSYVSQCGHAGLHTQSICCAEKKQPMHGREWVTSSWCKSLPPGLPISAITCVVNGWWLVVGVALLKPCCSWESGGFDYGEDCRTRLMEPCTIFWSRVIQENRGLAWLCPIQICWGNELQQWLIKNWKRLYLMHLFSDPTIQHIKANNIIHFSVVKQWQAQGIQVSQ